MESPNDFEKNLFRHELFSLNGDQFLRKAYQLILRRQADEQGITHYRRVLLKTGSKAQVALDLLASQEGKRHPCWTEMRMVVRQQRRREFWSFRKAKHVFGEDLSPQVSPPSIPDAQGVAAEVTQKLIEQIGRVESRLIQIDRRLDTSYSQRKLRPLVDASSRYLFNLSTSNHWRAVPVGIIRVERELARYLSNFSNVDFMLWDMASRTPRRLAAHQVDHILSDQWCDGQNGIVPYQSDMLPTLEVTSAHTYVSIGLDWDHAPTSQLVAYMKRFKARLVLACYDTIPIFFPEFTVRQTLQQEFRQHFVDMGHGADKVFAISQSTKSDLLRFWNEAGLETELPEIFTIPLGSYARASALPELTSGEAGIVEDVFRKGEYVLYVSSFEPRKNHRLLLDIWRDLWLERGEDCPQLVHVGMVGWGSNDLFARIPRMPAYINGKINGLQHVSDNLLAHLYHNASFTVFPSLYEGWGLAATEALSFNKICVVSNNSALPEATQGLMPAYHPLDFFGWKTEIERLLDDQPYRRALEQRINQQYRHQNWTNFSQSFCEHLAMEN